MNNDEIAIRYGVVRDYTAKKMNWHYPTLLMWAEIKGIHGLHLFEKSQLLKYTKDQITELYPAPQMHEIAPFIQEIRFKDFSKPKLRLGINYKKHIHVMKATLEYTWEWESKPFEAGQGMSVMVHDNHFAEAYAEMYQRIIENRYILDWDDSPIVFLSLCQKNPSDKDLLLENDR